MDCKRLEGRFGWRPTIKIFAQNNFVFQSEVINLIETPSSLSPSQTSSPYLCFAFFAFLFVLNKS